jgi:hypothetical protein
MGVVAPALFTVHSTTHPPGLANHPGTRPTNHPFPKRLLLTIAKERPQQAECECLVATQPSLSDRPPHKHMHQLIVARYQIHDCL